MGKVNITKKTGSTESLNLISAFKVENNTYVVFDSEKVGSMGLPIIYVSKYTTKLEKIADQNEWQSVKNYLKGIINGTNFEYVKIPDSLEADEAYYNQLSLPNEGAFTAIKSRYAIKEEPTATIEPLTPPPVEPVKEVAPVEEIPSVAPVVPPAPVANEPVVPAVDAIPNPEVNLNPNPIPVVNEPAVNVAPTAPIIPDAPVEPAAPVVEPAKEVSSLNFENDKETFLRACENMFDALVSKYQKELTDLENRERELKNKEQEIANKMQSASEYLEDAKAKEEVANIVHDNAQKVMDISNILPTNPESNETGVL